MFDIFFTLGGPKTLQAEKWEMLLTANGANQKQKEWDCGLKTAIAARLSRWFCKETLNL